MKTYDLEDTSGISYYPDMRMVEQHELCPGDWVKREDAEAKIAALEEKLRDIVSAWDATSFTMIPVPTTALTVAIDAAREAKEGGEKDG